MLRMNLIDIGLYCTTKELSDASGMLFGGGGGVDLHCFGYSASREAMNYAEEH
jgi:hypothetical protein